MGFVPGVRTKLPIENCPGRKGLRDTKQSSLREFPIMIYYLER